MSDLESALGEASNLFLQELSSPSKVVVVRDYTKSHGGWRGFKDSLRIFVHQWSLIHPDRVGMRDNYGFWQQSRDLIDGEDVHVHLTKRNEIEKTYDCSSEDERGNTKTTSLENITISSDIFSFKYYFDASSNGETINGTVVCEEIKNSEEVQCDD